MKKREEVEIGDLVSHVLMDSYWLGIVLGKKDKDKEEDDGKSIKEAARIRILSEHQFSTGKNRKVGWVDVDWLKIKSKAS